LQLLQFSSKWLDKFNEPETKFKHQQGFKSKRIIEKKVHQKILNAMIDPDNQKSQLYEKQPCYVLGLEESTTRKQNCID
jgi:hypothetical protein